MHCVFFLLNILDSVPGPGEAQKNFFNYGEAMSIAVYVQDTVGVVSLNFSAIRSAWNKKIVQAMACVA